MGRTEATYEDTFYERLKQIEGAGWVPPTARVVEYTMDERLGQPWRDIHATYLCENCSAYNKVSVRLYAAHFRKSAGSLAEWLVDSMKHTCGMCNTEHQNISIQPITAVLFP